MYKHYIFVIKSIIVNLLNVATVFEYREVNCKVLGLTLPCLSFPILKRVKIFSRIVCAVLPKDTNSASDNIRETAGVRDILTIREGGVAPVPVQGHPHSLSSVSPPPPQRRWFYSSPCTGAPT